MSISLDEVRHVARLARLELDEAEMMSLQSELNALLSRFVDIQSIDMSNFEATSHAMNMHSVWSDDTAGMCLPREDALANTPYSKAGMFVVPNILEG